MATNLSELADQAASVTAESVTPRRNNEKGGVLGIDAVLSGEGKKQARNTRLGALVGLVGLALLLLIVWGLASINADDPATAALRSQGQALIERDEAALAEAWIGIPRQLVPQPILLSDPGEIEQVHTYPIPEAAFAAVRRLITEDEDWRYDQPLAAFVRGTQPLPAAGTRAERLRELADRALPLEQLVNAFDDDENLRLLFGRLLFLTDDDPLRSPLLGNEAPSGGAIAIITGRQARQLIGEDQRRDSYDVTTYRAILCRLDQAGQTGPWQLLDCLPTDRRQTLANPWVSRINAANARFQPPPPPAGEQAL